MSHRPHACAALVVSALCACASAPAVTPDAGRAARSNIQHVIVISQENHSFDNYFGRYCTAPAGSNPTCTDGPACCEAAPATEPSGASPTTLDDAANGAYDPNHSANCENDEMNGGRMDRFVTGASCSDPRNWAIAPSSLVAPYHAFAREGALADRYFQAESGSTSANDMHFAVARHVFTDNTVAPMAIAAACNSLSPQMRYASQRTVADLVLDAGFTFANYIEGYAEATAAAPGCAQAREDCPARMDTYPCTYDASDIPFQYYPRFTDDPTYMRDFAQLQRDLDGGTLPHVVFIKSLGYHTEHPGARTRISDGVAWVQAVVRAIRASRYGARSLILLTYDEGGGYYDHVAPPAASAVDTQPYGVRIPTIALGPFARRNTVSHVPMEHASIVRFIEWNYTGMTGQLGARDATANNLGSLLDPAATGVAVPDR